MSSKFRIPTLLGIGILALGMAGGIILVNQNQSFKSKAGPSIVPKNITVTNISDTSASVFWQTDIPTTGFIQAGISSSLNLLFRDERDPQSPRSYKLHFVTLNNLKPNTTYNYKINSGELIYPENSTLNFQTPPFLPLQDYPPIIGTIINKKFQPVPEALITLELTGAQKLSTVTKMAGNFILPLSTFKTADLLQNFNLESSPSAKLIISDTNQSSEISFQLPLNKTLPPIVLGENMDLTPPSATPSPRPQQNFDLNNDKVVNALDSSIVLKNYGKNPQDKEADLNQDGTVDQKDLLLFANYLSQNSRK